MSESLPLVSVPKSISRESVRGAIVTTPDVADTGLFRAIESALSKTSPVVEVIAPELVIEAP